MNEVPQVKKKWYKTWYGILLIVTVLIIGISSVSNTPTKVTETTPAPAPETAQAEEENAVAKEQAQKELDDLMSKAKAAGLVTSYDFSKLDEKLWNWEVFVGKVWYTQTVQQKKDFIAYISLRKEVITGYRHFKLYDGYTNEKVAEVASFSGSIEVYK
jgi:hypothetical protein